MSKVVVTEGNSVVSHDEYNMQDCKWGFSSCTVLCNDLSSINLWKWNWHFPRFQERCHVRSTCCHHSGSHFPFPALWCALAWGPRHTPRRSLLNMWIKILPLGMWKLSDGFYCLKNSKWKLAPRRLLEGPRCYDHRQMKENRMSFLSGCVCVWYSLQSSLLRIPFWDPWRLKHWSSQTTEMWRWG